MSQSQHVLLEVAIASADDAEAAERGGADRVELNAALWLGGLTPSLGMLVEARARTTLPIVAMVRPRGGGFAYSESEFSAMRRDVDFSLAHGANGIAFGILNARGEIDESRCRRLIAPIGNPQHAVFHRAFDVVPEPFEALEILIAMGVRRVMTSGQEETAYNGAEKIAALRERAAGRIEILPAGGINRFTLIDVLSRTGCDQIHASLKTLALDCSTSSRPKIAFGGMLRPPENQYETTDTSAVADVRKRLSGS